MKKHAAFSLMGKIKSVEKSQDIKEIFQSCISLGVPEEFLRFSHTLARGLNYYTGMIFEVKIPSVLRVDWRISLVMNKRLWSMACFCL